MKEEILKKAKEAGSVEELIAFADGCGMELTCAEAGKISSKSKKMAFLMMRSLVLPVGAALRMVTKLAVIKKLYRETGC